MATPTFSQRGSSSGATPSLAGRSNNSAGANVVRITGINQIKLGARSERRIWLPTPQSIINLTGATAAQAPQITKLDPLPPHTVALWLNVEIIVNSGTSQNVLFHALSGSGSGFAGAAGTFQHNQVNSAAGQIIAPMVDGGLSWQVAIGGTVNYDLHVNLVAVEVQ